MVDLVFMLYARGPDLRDFFDSFWNVYDFCVTVGCVLGTVLLQDSNQGAAQVLRTLRLLRFYSTFKYLRALVEGLF